MLLMRARAAPSSSSSSTAAASAALSTSRRRPLARPLRFKEEEREQQEKREREDALAAARERCARAELEAKKAIEDAAQAVKDAARSTSVKPRPVGPETAFVNSIPFYVPAFTRYKEVAVGRVAMLAMAVSPALEIMRPGHPGSLQQIAQNFSCPLPTVELALGAFVLHGLLGLWPSSPTYSEWNARDFLRREPGPPSIFVNPLRSPARFLGVAPFSWGFFKRNELLHGRIAMLAFLASCAAEIKTGGLGTIGQAAYWLGKAGVDVGIGTLPALPNDDWYARTGGAILAWSLFCFALAYARGERGEGSGGDDVY